MSDLGKEIYKGNSIEWWYQKATAYGNKAAELSKANDELVSALEEMMFAYVNKDADFPHDFELKAQEQAKQALAKHKGEEDE